MAEPEPPPKDMPPAEQERRSRLRRQHETALRLLAEARAEGVELQEYLELYLDLKDWGAGGTYYQVPEAVRPFLRAIRQATGGRFGNPPLL